MPLAAGGRTGNDKCGERQFTATKNSVLVLINAHPVHLETDRERGVGGVAAVGTDGLVQDEVLGKMKRVALIRAVGRGHREMIHEFAIQT